MKIVYNNKTNSILSIISKNQKPRTYKNIPLEDISLLISDWYPEENMQYYKVKNNKIVKRSQTEIEELQRYRRILTPDERTLNKLKPPHEEIQKAQNTIEILTLIQEVF